MRILFVVFSRRSISAGLVILHLTVLLAPQIRLLCVHKLGLYLFTYLHSDAMAVFGFFSENFLLAVIGVDYVIKLLRTDVQRTRAVRRQVPLISTGESFDVGPMT